MESHMEDLMMNRLDEEPNADIARLRAMGGVVTYGHPQSPVVPMMVYSFSKMAACVEWLTARGVASVGVGFPATLLHQARIRFCLSAAHTREQLGQDAIEAVADELGLRYSRLPLPPTDH